MGKAKKSQPSKLPAKLFLVRKFFGFSQADMIKFVIPGVKDAEAARAAVSDYEAGRRTPSVLETLSYAKAVRLLSRYKHFNVEELIDDRRELPFAFYGKTKPAESERYPPSARSFQRQNRSLTAAKSDRKISLKISPEKEAENESKDESENKSYGGEEDEVPSPAEPLSNEFFSSESAMAANEIYTVDLPAKTLVPLDDMRLDLLKQMPHFWRPKLTEEKFIELLLNAVIAEYDDGRGSSSVVEKLKTKLSARAAESSSGKTE